MGRLYSVTVSGSSVSAAVDLFEVTAATGKPFWLRTVRIGQTSDFGDAALEGLGLLVKRAAGAFTSGSGGSAATPARLRSADAAASATAEVLNTTQASAGSGTLTTIDADVWYAQLGGLYQPPPEERPLFAPGEACVVSLTAPADALTVYAVLVFEEEG